MIFKKSDIKNLCHANDFFTQYLFHTLENILELLAVAPYIPVEVRTASKIKAVRRAVCPENRPLRAGPQPSAAALRFDRL
jgi:hypothetical protein